MVINEHNTKELTKNTEYDVALRYSCLRTIIASSLLWSNNVPLNRLQILASIIRMVGPIALGAIFGNLQFGMLASYGAMVVSGAMSDGTIRQQTLELMGTMLVTTTAIFSGSLIGGYSWLTGGGIVIISFLAVLLGGMGRGAAKASTRFMIFTIIGTSVGEGGLHPNPYVLAFIFATGSLWGIVVSLISTFLFSSSKCTLDPVPAVVISYKERMKRWERSLSHFEGWQYTLRVTLSMIAAEVIDVFLYQHQQRSSWIFMTVALVLQRNFASAFTRILQRGIGTAAGVLLSGLLLLWTLPSWGFVLIIGILAALRSFFQERNYAIYTMIMTPLIMLIISLGKTVTGSLLIERLLDTTIGCIIALTLGYFIWPNRA